MTKAELRKIYVAARKNLSASEISRDSQRINERFFRAFDLSRIKILHCFLPIERFNEINTSLILKRISENFPAVETVAPRVNGQTGEIESLKFSAQTIFEQSSWGISEPPGDEIFDAAKIDLVLVPLLCFDRRGFRVGYGKGFYDKFLKNCRADCLKIGLSYFAPVEAISDVQNFDIRLDHCVTPEKVWNFIK